MRSLGTKEIFNFTGEADGESIPEYLNFGAYVVALPILAALGIVGNLISFCVFLHHEMRSFCSLLLDALLLSDSVYLVCLVLCKTPVASLWHIHASPTMQNDPNFWNYLGRVQRINMGAYPMQEISWCLVVWYSVAIILEQYFVYRTPSRLAKWSRPDCAIKITITIAICSVLIHLVSFFKFQRIPVTYGTHDHMKICLSQLYRDGGFQTYDRYVYFVLFIFLPSIGAVLTVPLMVMAYQYSKVKDYSHYNRTAWLEGDQRLIRVFKSGRSTHIVFTLSFLFAVCQAVLIGIYLDVVAHIDLNPLSARCHKLPEDRTFSNQSATMQRTYYFTSVIYSSLNFPVFLIFGKDFRKTLCAFFKRTPKKLGAVPKVLAMSVVEDKKEEEVTCDDLFDTTKRRLEVHDWMRKNSTSEDGSTYI